MSYVVIEGFSDASKVPGFYGETKYAQSAVKFGSAPLKVLCCGLRSSSGDLVYDQEVRRILDKTAADTAAGAGSELARQLYAALDECRGMDGYELYACAPTPAGGAVAATVVATLSGTATAAGTIKLWIGGDNGDGGGVGTPIEVNIPNTTTANDASTAINTEIAKHTRIPATSGVVAPAVTLTAKCAGIRGNQLTVYVDFSGAPGLTVVLSGAGTALSGTTTVVGRTFGGGTGTETLTAMLAALYPLRFNFIAPAQNDATSLAAWEAQADLKAGPLEGKMEHLCVASSGNFAAVTSLAQTTLNNQRFNMQWLESSEVEPSMLAAAFACLRGALEGTTPNKAYDDRKLRVARPQRFSTDWCSTYTEKQAALDVGVTPLETRPDGSVYIVRAITTRCLDGAAADYRTLDTSESFVPDYVRDRLKSVYGTEFRPANPHVRPDPVAGEPEVPEGVATPSLWNGRVTKELFDMEREKILCQVALNLPSSEYNYTANRIMSAVPAVPLPHQHQIGVSVRQLNVSAP